MKKFVAITTAAAMAVASFCTAADAPAVKPIDAAKAAVAQAVKPVAQAVSVDTFLALIPEVIGTYVDETNVIEVKSDQFKQNLKPMLENLLKSGQPFSVDMFKQYLPSIITDYILQEYVIKSDIQKKDLKITPVKLAEVKSELENFKKEAPDKYAEFLKEQGCATDDDLIKKFEPAILFQVWQAKIVETVSVSEADAKAYFEKEKLGAPYYSCYHILAKFPDPEKEPTAEEDAAALKKINDIYARIQKGEDFSKLAEELSDCPSGKQGGHLDDYDLEGKLPEGQMVPEFTKAFNALKPGSITEIPVKTKFGYHIIKASEPKVTKFEEIKTQIIRQLTADAQRKAFAQYIEKLKKDYQITVK